MKNQVFSRRQFIRTSALLAASAAVFPVSAQNKKSVYRKASTAVPLKWLEDTDLKYLQGVTWGVPWPKGLVKENTEFQLRNEHNESLAVQAWPLAYWPDGSVKWSGYAVNKVAASSGALTLKPGTAQKTSGGILVKESDTQIEIDTRRIRCVLNKKGSLLIESIEKDGKKQLLKGKLVMITQNCPDSDTEQDINKKLYTGEIGSVSIEQQGPVRTVVKIEGTHRAGPQDALILFVVRLYFYHESESVKIMHTLIYDGDENKLFIKGLGFRFAVAMEDELHNRHIRFVGEEGGVFAEGVRGLTGLRRDPGQEIRSAQVRGAATPAVSEFPDVVSKRLHLIPAFGDYTLYQGSSGSFTIKKRTSSNHSWLNAGHGGRSAGTGYLGSPSVGVAFGIRNFWQSYPAQIDIRGAHSQLAEITLWLWAPESPAMDLRFYHDGMGMDDFDKQNEGLEITYEDYESGYGTPYGVARTSEMQLWIMGTPANEQIAGLARSLQHPALLICEAGYLQEQKVFGGNWSLPDRSSAAKRKIEERLDWSFDFYKKQIDQFDWYGFWNYGDVMHSYDTDRHTWKYDIGGFAWDNSELSTDLWLWYYFLRSSRPDAFRMAEAMTRHTGEVDVHHIGRFAPLGSRHNVMHWGCSAKQLRISTALNRRFLYYLTADERIGDLLKEQVEGVKTLVDIKPLRKREKFDDESMIQRPSHIVHASFGTDWGSVAAAWLTEWERTGYNAVRDKLLRGMESIAAQPKMFFTGAGYFDFNTGAFEITKKQDISISHLSAAFGLTEVCEELLLLLDVPGFKKAWLQYCRLYNASREEQEQELGSSVDKLNLRQGHARLTAFAAHSLKDEALAKRAWKEFNLGAEQGIPELSLVPRPLVLNPIEEYKDAGTNGAAQWGLSAIQCLAYAGKYI
ncbi:hypothetical protein [Arcticibacter sp.]|uniref:exo-rhamnogalacturonan lyase family protein n=1 Tax=Arcticibacter sp. TaxID=1872630 RepID=UPI00388E349C